MPWVQDMLGGQQGRILTALDGLENAVCTRDAEFQVRAARLTTVLVDEWVKQFGPADLSCKHDNARFQIVRRVVGQATIGDRMMDQWGYHIEVASEAIGQKNQIVKLDWDAFAARPDVAVPKIELMTRDLLNMRLSQGSQGRAENGRSKDPQVVERTIVAFNLRAECDTDALIKAIKDAAEACGDQV